MLNKLFSFSARSDTQQSVKDSYQQPPSISEKLPWMEYDPVNQCFLLEDGRSVGALFELSDVASEARSEAFLLKLQQGLQGVLQDAFPPYFDDESPWIVQFFLQDELSLEAFYESFRSYIQKNAQDTLFTQTFLRLMASHLALLTKPDGFFNDTKVSGTVFRGKVRKIRAVIYRRLTSKSVLRKGRDAIRDLNAVAQTFVAKLENTGICVKRGTGKDFYEWMVPWFNPSPQQGKGSSEILLKNAPYPGDEAMPFGYDFSEKLFFSVPHSDHEASAWFFDDKPHRYITILGLNSLPESGHLTLTRSFGNLQTSLFDKFPVGSIFQLTVIIQNQAVVKNHLFQIEHSTKRATSTEAEMAREDCALAKRAIESGNHFFPTVMGVYIRGDNLNDLEDKTVTVETLLSSNGFHALSGGHELKPLDSYLRYLPFAYSFAFDKARLLRSRYLSGQQIAKLLPLYGRERGTGHPGVTLFNRTGEAFTFDPFNPKDKDFNSHLLLLGTTGSGKSALCVYLMMQIMAVYRPRLVVIDAGNSFGLLSDYFKTQGLSVHRVEISFEQPVSLNPFADSRKLLQQVNKRLINDEARVFDLEADTDAPSEQRDYLGDMVLAAQLMITGGEKKEIEAITRQDRYWILKAVLAAAENAESAGRDQMIADDVVAAFHQLANYLEKENKPSEADTVIRLKKMAEQMGLFCQDHLSALYFNRPGKPWPEADVTVLEMGIFKEEGYEAQRALAFMGAMQKTMNLAEQHQYEERFTVLFADECHVVTSNPVTALSVTRCAKMSRKLGLWLWFATQNVQDFPNEARKMLSMMEFWICLGMSEQELEEVERFKTLTDEERTLFRSVRKEAKKYVEGVILCNRFKGLFRNIPPRLALALAMTEKHEKAERKAIIKQYGCSEVEAAERVAAKVGGTL